MRGRQLIERAGRLEGLQKLLAKIGRQVNSTGRVGTGCLNGGLCLPNQGEAQARLIGGTGVLNDGARLRRGRIQEHGHEGSG